MENKIKLLILDIDGVLTSGKKIYNPDGECYFKEFNDKDFTAIKKFKASGVEVVFLSGDKRVNEKIAQKRNIKFYYSCEGRRKDVVLQDIMLEHNIPNINIAGVGDDLFDLDFLKHISYAYCPSDAIPEVKEVCVTLSNKGGDGVVAELYSLVEKQRLLPKSYKYEDILNLDKKETW